MKSNDGCGLWVLGITAWTFVWWFLCGITDLVKIDPIIVLVYLPIAIIIIIFIVLCVIQFFKDKKFDRDRTSEEKDALNSMKNHVFFGERKNTILRLKAIEKQQEEERKRLDDYTSIMFPSIVLNKPSEEDSEKVKSLMIAYPKGFDEYCKQFLPKSFSDIIRAESMIANFEEEARRRDAETKLKRKENREQKKRIEEESRIKKEEEEKKQREEAERIRLEEAKKIEEREFLYHQAINIITSNVQHWVQLHNDFYYTWLFYYYPTTCNFEATDEEWDNRYIVWNFKNDPAKGVSELEHEEALDEVIPLLKERLIDTFEEENIPFLTMVCLPASTKAKNEARYKEFSERLCQETGMENGYEYIHFIRDGLSKNDPNNEMGRSIQPKVAFDDWFENKYVLLFDDVVTKGNTMLRYKRKLEEVGAVVVGGICLGKTKHSRVEL